MVLSKFSEHIIHKTGKLLQYRLKEISARRNNVRLFLDLLTCYFQVVSKIGCTMLPQIVAMQNFNKYDRLLTMPCYSVWNLDLVSQTSHIYRSKTSLKVRVLNKLLKITLEWFNGEIPIHGFELSFDMKVGECY